MGFERTSTEVIRFREGDYALATYQDRTDRSPKNVRISVYRLGSPFLDEFRQ